MHQRLMLTFSLVLQLSSNTDASPCHKKENPKGNKFHLQIQQSQVSCIDASHYSVDKALM